MEGLESKPQRLPFQIYALGAVSFLMDVASEMVYPLLPLFLVGSLGMGKEIVKDLLKGLPKLLQVFPKWCRADSLTVLLHANLFY